MEGAARALCHGLSLARARAQPMAWAFAALRLHAATARAR